MNPRNSRTTELALGVAGPSGRMGAAVIALVGEGEGVRLAAAIGRPGFAAPDLPIRSPKDALTACDVIVDFSTPPAATALASAAAARGGPALVIGVTGLNEGQEAAIVAASRRIAIVKSGNFSAAVNLLAALVETAADRLPAQGWDVEIVEAHHRGKIDAPSGTALMLGEAVAQGRGRPLSTLAASPRQGDQGPRPTGEIGFASLRGGGLVGEHMVIFAGDDEILTLAHSARDRRLFARGALQAARWVRGRSPGLYNMRDVLGLERR